MKLKNEQEIEEIAKQYAIEEVYGDSESEGFENTVADYGKGYTQAQQDLLASASESFEEWWECQNLLYPNIYKDAWQACSLHHAKKVQEKDAEIEKLKAEIGKFKSKAFLANHYKFHNCDCPPGMDCDCNWSKGEAK